MWHDEKGLTLVELLVAMALIGLLLAGVFHLLIYGARVYQEGNEQVDLQREVRYAVDYITKEVRYARFIRVLQDPDTVDPEDDFDPDLDIIPESPAAVNGDSNYIFLGGTDQSVLMHLNAAGKHELTPAVVESLLFSTRHRQFNFNIVAAQGDRNYSADITLLLLNFVPPDSGMNQIPAIRYTK